MARLHGWDANTPLNAMVGPGIGLFNVDETLLTPAAPWDMAAQDAFINSGTPFGATDDGWAFAYEPDYQEWEYAGVPGGVRNGKRINRVDVSLSGSVTEFTQELIPKYMPGTDVSTWQTTEATPTPIGNIFQPRGHLLDTDYINNICVIAERQGQKIGGIFLIYNAMNVESFELGFEGDENRSSSDMTFNGHYGVNSQNATTGGWNPPCKIYLTTPSVAA